MSGQGSVSLPVGDGSPAPSQAVPGIEVLPGGTRVWTSPHHRIGTDALLLARFCPVRPAWRAVDLGSGCGILLLALVDRGLAGGLGLELDPEGAALLEGAAREQGLAVEALAGDLRSYRPAKAFDLAVANPPYFRAGKASPDERRATARHQGEEGLTIASLCQAASSMVKYGGRFCLCYPAQGLAGLFSALEAAGFAPKRCQLVRGNAGAPARLALVEARRGGGEGLLFLPDILAEDDPVKY